MFANVFPHSRGPRGLRRAPWLAVSLGLALASTACGTTRVERQSVVQNGGIEAFLRSYRKGGEEVEQGFNHPAPIAAVRLAHILSFIDVEVGEGKKRERIAAVDPVIIYEVGDALEQALDLAGPNQEVVVMAVRKERRLGIFHATFLTSFIAYVKGDLLTIQLGHANWEVPKIDQSPGDDLPEPRRDRDMMPFRVVPDPALTLLGPKTVAVDWRSDAFRDPTRIQLSPSGEVRRRTVLMEDDTPLDEEAAPEGTIRLDDLTPEKLRDLADLEEQRRAGEVTEAEYQRRRLEILKR